MTRVLVVATSRKTRGGITAVVKAHETGEQWDKFHCRWIETHRDGPAWRKVWYFVTALTEYIILLPFYDIVHIHMATTQSAKRKMWFLLLAYATHKKIIVHFHPSNEKFLYQKNTAQLYRKLFSKADIVLVLSQQWIRWIHDTLGEGEWMDKMSVLYNPCPQVQRNVKMRKNHILYAGTLIKRKGYDILIQAFGRVAKEFLYWKLVMAGNAYLQDGIDELQDGKNIAERLGIINQVFFLGWIEGCEKERVFQESSIYCLASEGEGFPMGLLDAWAYGIPSVVTPVGGIPDIVRNGVHGLLFPVGDIDALANSLKLLMSNEELRHKIAQNADFLVNNEFSIFSINKQLGEIYSSL